MLTHINVEYPKNSVFYLTKVQDFFSGGKSAKITGTKQRDTDSDEIDKFAEAISAHVPWQHEAQLDTANKAPRLSESSTSCSDGQRAARNRSPVRRAPLTYPSPSPSPDATRSKVKREDFSDGAPMSPLVTPGAPDNTDPEYKTNVQNLIVSVHKAAGEWFKKSREFSLAVVKSESQPLTKGGHLEEALGMVCKDGNELATSMDDAERKYVMNELVPHIRQVEIKRGINEIYDLIKQGNKIKLL